MQKPARKPKSPNFSSGPCTKPPSWDVKNLSTEAMGRSHRSKLGKSRIKLAFDLTKEVLELPDDYLVGMIAGSDTGAIECAMWSMLGPKKVDVLAWESFGSGWVTDIVKQLKLDATEHKADYGQIPDLTKVSWKNDVVFLWNGTTSGACIPNGDWIPDDREGLSICDGTSAAFAMPIPWNKIDVFTFSWQKCLGGEAAHGILILSPRAVARIESYTPSWPMPKIFRIKKGNGINKGIFTDSPINTPSMLCFEDYINALNWAKQSGGSKGLNARSNASLQAVENWVKDTPHFEFLTTNKEIRSNTSVCISIVDPRFTSQDLDKQKETVNAVAKYLEEEGIAYDIKGYRDAPLGFRFWCGPTVEATDVEIALDWLSYAYETTISG